MSSSAPTNVDMTPSARPTQPDVDMLVPTSPNEFNMAMPLPTPPAKGTIAPVNSPDPAALESPVTGDMAQASSYASLMNGNKAKVNGDGDLDDHPDGNAIRRQVEYYFSDENLPHDYHMLQCTGGRKNLPVSVSRILAFKRMRIFKPKKLVVKALRKSAFLEVSEDGKTIKRKVALRIPTIVDEDDSDGEIAYDPNSIPLKPVVKGGQGAIKGKVPLLNQIKPELPPGVTKNMLKPTGFEPTYVEGPITPDVAEEEERLYDSDKAFVDRIEIAIQRFKQKRRMHSIYSKVFNKWMLFGGVDCSPRAFGGVSKQDLEHMDAEDIARTLATHHVPADRDNEDEWVVDFVGVAKGFLSSYFPAKFGHDEQEVATACKVLKSFYNYLLFHNVCPEYQADILLARDVCDLAATELVKCSAAGLEFPGNFNEAASTLFGGYYSGLFAGNAAWAEGDENVIGWAHSIGMMKEEAAVVFKTGVGVYGNDGLYETVNAEGIKGLKLLHEENVGLCVTAIKKASDDVLAIYTSQNQAWEHKLSFTPLGKLICSRWEPPDFDEWDFPKGYKQPPSYAQTYEFWVEDNVLEHCFIGMKLEGRVSHFDHELMILDNVNQVHPSFYTYLANELWVQNKPKEIKYMKRGAAAEDEEEGLRIIAQQEEKLANGDSDDVAETLAKRAGLLQSVPIQESAASTNGTHGPKAPVEPAADTATGGRSQTLNADKHEAYATAVAECQITYGDEVAAAVKADLETARGFKIDPDTVAKAFSKLTLKSSKNPGDDTEANPTAEKNGTAEKVGTADKNGTAEENCQADLAGPA